MNSLISEMPGPDVGVKARVLRLNDAEPFVAGIRIYAELLTVITEGIHQRGRRRDRVPGPHRGARENKAQTGRLVARDENVVAVVAHRLGVHG
jgi:hypothetical protein